MGEDRLNLVVQRDVSSLLSSEKHVAPTGHVYRDPKGSGLVGCMMSRQYKFEETIKTSLFVIQRKYRDVSRMRLNAEQARTLLFVCPSFNLRISRHTKNGVERSCKQQYFMKFSI